MAPTLLVLLFLSAFKLVTGAATFPVQQLTTNSLDEDWGILHSVTSSGKILWEDGAGTVVLFDGNNTNVVQLQGNLSGVDTVFALGSGPVSTPDQVIAVWRRSTDSGWISRNGATPVAVTAVNPFANVGHNAEGVAIKDGAVFMILQAFSGGQAIKHVFQVDPVTGIATSLTGTNAVPGAAGRLTTSLGQAAWPFLDNANAIFKLHFYDGSALRVIDTNIIGSPHLARGRMVYTKTVGTFNQVFLYDSTLPNPAPVQLTTDATSKSFPRTDGEHVAWLTTPAGSTNVALILNGGIQVTDAETALPASPGEYREAPFQLDRSQLFWKDFNRKLRYLIAGGLYEIPPAPGIDFGGNNCCMAWLTDGFLAALGLSQDNGSDSEVFRITGSPPSDSRGPVAPLLIRAAPGSGSITLTWDQILSADSYNLYLANDPRVTPDNYQSLTRGERITGVTSPYTVSGLTNRAYFFAITAVSNGVEGLPSGTLGVPLWQPIANLSNATFNSIDADNGTSRVAFAAAGLTTYQSADDGATWFAQSAINGTNVRAVAVQGSVILAASSGGDLYRSTDTGTNWTMISDGTDIGEGNKTVRIHPLDPSILYAGNFSLSGMTEPEDSFLIKSTNGGLNWFHLPDPLIPPGAELRGYTIALPRSDLETVYVGGSGTPNFAKSTNGGLSWINVSMGPGYVISSVVDPTDKDIVYAGNFHFTQVSRGVYKSTNGGGSWVLKNNGFPTLLPKINSLVINPASPQQIHAGTDLGYFFSLDGGDRWVFGNAGLRLNSLDSHYINALEFTASGRLLAATANGLFTLDLSLSPLQPRLAIARSGSSVRISWPAFATGFELRSTEQLNAASVWTRVSAPVIETNNQATVNFIPAVPSTSMFFRLQPP